MTALLTNDRALAANVSRMDNAVDRLNEEIKLYVTKLTRDSRDEREGRREILAAGRTGCDPAAATGEAQCARQRVCLT
jgi:Na+/phosphate symporter